MMTNTLAVCLLTIFFCCTSLSSARQTPKECFKGPSYWCQNLKQAADCGAVQHCIATVWEQQHEEIKANYVSNKIVRLFKELKDIRDMINVDYLGKRVASACSDIDSSDIARMCKANTAYLQDYINHLLDSETTPETMCRVIGMCNNEKIHNIINREKAKNDEVTKHRPKLVGAGKCTWGPSYWCSNFSTVKECGAGASHHCVQRVWSKISYPEDNDSVCQICKDMVQQARDQLESNETQLEIKEVFEGSCKLIVLKPIVKECIKLADDFVPELVETLASQMNPVAVCSVAGLCNNGDIDEYLRIYDSKLQERNDCSKCKRSVGIVRKRFDETTYENFLVSLLQMCQNFGSLSDSCSMLSFRYYENIIAALKKDLQPLSLCRSTQYCSTSNHTHDNLYYTFPEEEEIKSSDDVPCDFCVQIVKHLRDTLVANTSEVEFHKVLIGLCKQTGSFKSECLSLVERYHSEVYHFFVSEIAPNTICDYIGICSNKSEPIAPLLPTDLAQKLVTMPVKRIGEGETTAKNPTNDEIHPAPKKQENVQILGTENAASALPIERMFVSVPSEGAWCSFCQYFLHYLQVELSDDNTEEAIKKAVEEACDVLPESINDQCRQFVTEYGPSVIALLVQEIDPASVCPALGLCAKTEEIRRVSINSDKSNCALCLFAVEQLETMLKNNRTEESIREALKSLCNHLSAKLRTECIDFADTYSNQLIEMLLADLNAQEICVYLKLCQDNKKYTDPLDLGSSQIDKYHNRPYLRGDRNNRKKPMLPEEMLETGTGLISTNEIVDNTMNGRQIEKPSQSTMCVLCEFVLKEIDDEIKDKHNEDEIKKVVHGICKTLPKSIRPECDQFVEKYADLVITLLVQEMDPDEVCRELKFCDPTLKDTKEIVKKPMNVVQKEESNSICYLCDFVLTEINYQIKDKHNEDEIKKVVHGIANTVPEPARPASGEFVETYADFIINLLVQQNSPDEVCWKLNSCVPTAFKIFKGEILDCAVCETVVMAVQKVFSNDKVDRDIVSIIEKSCVLLPRKYNNRCHTMLEVYGKDIIQLIEKYGTKDVCKKLQLCSTSGAAIVQMDNTN